MAPSKKPDRDFRRHPDFSICSDFMHVDFTTAGGEGFLISEQVRIAFWSTGGRATGIAVVRATWHGCKEPFPQRDATDLLSG